MTNVQRLIIIALGDGSLDAAAIAKAIWPGLAGNTRTSRRAIGMARSRLREAVEAGLISVENLPDGSSLYRRRPDARHWLLAYALCEEAVHSCTRYPASREEEPAVCGSMDAVLRKYGYDAGRHKTRGDFLDELRGMALAAARGEA